PALVALRLSVQSILCTPELGVGSVAVAVPVAGAVLNQPLDPFGEKPLMETDGDALSSLMMSVLAVSTLPALSAAKKLTVVVPSVVTGNEALAPSSDVFPIVCAPVAL